MRVAPIVAPRTILGTLLVIGIGTASLLCPPVSAAQTCPFRNTAVFYVNGVGNDFDTARDRRDRLRLSLRHRLLELELPSECITVGLAFNQTEGIWRDLVEAYGQASGQNDYSVFWDTVFGVFVDGIAVSTFLEGASRIDQASWVEAATLADHTVAYIESRRAGRNVLLVAHSQGNFYANAAHESLVGGRFFPPEELAIVSVATPAGFVAGRAPGSERYTTLRGDFIHLVAGALPPNI